MIKRNFAAALVAAGMFALASVSQATVLNLGSSGSGTVNGALFETNNDHPTGTGVYNPFLTVQNDPWEQGFDPEPVAGESIAGADPDEDTGEDATPVAAEAQSPSRRRFRRR